MLEDSVSPNKANIIQHDTFKSKNVNTESVAKPAVLRPGAEGAKPFAVGHVTTLQQTTVSGQIITGHTPPAASQMQQTKVTSVVSEPQRALLTTISSGREIIKHTEEHLIRAELPALGQDAASVKWKQVTMEGSKQAVTSHIAAMNAATAQVVTLTSGPIEEVDHTAVGAAITTITTNLPEMTKGVQMIAALMDDSDNGDRLLDATRKLCSAFSDLLKAAEPETKEPRQSLLNAASRVGEASTSVLHTIGDDAHDKETQDILLSLAKAVANTTAALVLKAKNVAAQCKDDQPLQNTIIHAATQCALATSQLVACTKVVAPTLNNPACRDQLVSAARQVARAVDRLVDACKLVPDQQGPGVEQLTAAAQRVTEELEKLLHHCTQERRIQPTVEERTVESVMSASEGVAAAADATEMVRHARLLGQATATLITNIKTEAEKQPSDAQRKLLAAAKLLADATARMVEAARQCASSPQDREKQEALRKAAEELRFITVDYAQGQDMVGAQRARLQDSARQAAASGTRLVAQARSAAQYNTGTRAQVSCTHRDSTESARQAAASGTRLVAQARSAAQYNTGTRAQVSCTHRDSAESARQAAASGTRLVAQARSAAQYNTGTRAQVSCTHRDSTESARQAAASGTRLVAQARSAAQYNTGTRAQVSCTHRDSAESARQAAASGTRLVAQARSAAQYNTGTRAQVSCTHRDSTESARQAAASGTRLVAQARSAAQYNTGTRAQVSCTHRDSAESARQAAASGTRLVAQARSAAQYNTGTRAQVSCTHRDSTESARQAAASGTRLVAQARSAAQYNTGTRAQEMFLQECRVLSECIPRVVDAVKVSTQRPDEAAAQLDLISASEALLQPSGHVIQAARGALPTISDASTAKNLSETTQQFTNSCADLRSAVSRARISCKGLELDAAAEIIRSLQGELDELEEAARAFHLTPLPEQTSEWASSTMQTASRSAASSTAQLVSAVRVADGGAAGRAACDLARALRHFSAGLRAATALQEHADTRDKVIWSGRTVLNSSLVLVESVKQYLSTSEQVDTTTIVSIAKDISHGLEQTMAAVPSHRELDLAMENINQTLNILDSGEFPPSDRAYGELQSELNAAAVGLSSASSEVVSTVDRPAALADSSTQFGDAFNRLLGVSMEMAGQTEVCVAMSWSASAPPDSSTQFGDAFNRLLGVSMEMAGQTEVCVAMSWSASAPPDSSTQFGDAFNRLLGVSMEMAGQTEVCVAMSWSASAPPDSSTQLGDAFNRLLGVSMEMAGQTEVCVAMSWSASAPPDSSTQFGDAFNRLLGVSMEMAGQTEVCVAMSWSASAPPDSSTQFGDAFNRLLGVSMEMAGQTEVCVAMSWSASAPPDSSTQFGDAFNRLLGVSMEMAGQTEVCVAMSWSASAPPDSSTQFGDAFNRLLGVSMEMAGQTEVCVAMSWSASAPPDSSTQFGDAFNRLLGVSMEMAGQTEVCVAMSWSASAPPDSSTQFGDAFNRLLGVSMEMAGQTEVCVAMSWSASAPPDSSTQFGDAFNRLLGVSMEMAGQTEVCVAMSWSASAPPDSSTQFGDAFNRLLGVSMEMAGQTEVCVAMSWSASAPPDSSTQLGDAFNRLLGVSMEMAGQTEVCVAMSWSASAPPDSSTQFGDAFNRLLGVSMEMAGQTEVCVAMSWSASAPPDSSTQFGDAFNRLLGVSMEMAGQTEVCVAMSWSASAPPDSSTQFGDAFNRLLGVSMEMAGQTEDRETRTQMVTWMRSVTVTSSKLLGTARSVSQDPARPNARNQLAHAAREVTSTINRLVDVCTSAAPGQKECAAAIRSIESMRPLLDSPTQPVNELGYFACLDAVVEQSKALSEGMSGMASAVKRSAHEQLAQSVSSVASAVQGLVESTAQAGYLVAVSDETSVAGRPGLVDQARFARAALAIEQACRALQDSTSDQQQVLSAATIIAKHTSALCNACREASGRTADAQDKRHLVQAAKDVANSTAALVKEIKALDALYSEAAKDVANSTAALVKEIKALDALYSEHRRARQGDQGAGRPLQRGEWPRRAGECNACREASGRTADAQDKRHLVQAAKDVANSTAALVKEIKALDALYSEHRRARQGDQGAGRPLQRGEWPRRAGECSARREASGRTADAQDKRHLVQAAKDVANSTAALVKEIKALDALYSEHRRARQGDQGAGRPLQRGEWPRRAGECSARREASGRTADAQDKRHLVQAAKDVANSTAALVKEIKALDALYSEAAKDVANSTAALVKEIKALDALYSEVSGRAGPASAARAGKRPAAPPTRRTSATWCSPKTD
ncbi:hypothetical protein O0L34_g13352 [Tuta absoluta]|nr:hypothetical protein O0L34_g13352 [Tuta absoluta]